MIDSELIERIRADDADGVHHILEQRPESVSGRDEAGRTPLHLAAEFGSVGAIRILLEAGGDVHARAPWGDTPLEWAAAMGHGVVAERLLEAGARGYSFWTAAALGDLDGVRRFLDSARSPEELRRPQRDDNERGWPADTAYRLGDAVSDAFYAAARNGHTPVAALLLERGANVDAKGYFGASGLHWAAHLGHGEMVRWLLEHGARSDQEDPQFGATPEGWARENGHMDLAELLSARAGT